MMRRKTSGSLAFEPSDDLGEFPVEGVPWIFANHARWVTIRSITDTFECLPDNSFTPISRSRAAQCIYTYTASNAFGLENPTLYRDSNSAGDSSVRRRRELCPPAAGPWLPASLQPGF